MRQAPLRLAAVATGLGTVAWQGNVLRLGEAAENIFFLPDIVIGLLLAGAGLTRREHRADLAMLVGFSLIAGVFAVSTLGGLWIGDESAGPISTAIGLLICVPAIGALAKRLATANLANDGSGA